MTWKDIHKPNSVYVYSPIYDPHRLYIVHVSEDLSSITECVNNPVVITNSVADNDFTNFQPLENYLIHLAEEVGTNVVDSNHPCTCDIMVLMQQGCKCGGK